MCVKCCFILERRVYPKQLFTGNKRSHYRLCSKQMHNISTHMLVLRWPFTHEGHRGRMNSVYLHVKHEQKVISAEFLLNWNRMWVCAYSTWHGPVWICGLASLLMSDGTLIQLLFKLTWYWCVCMLCMSVCLYTTTRGKDLLSYQFMWCPLIALEENSAVQKERNRLRLCVCRCVHVHKRNLPGINDALQCGLAAGHHGCVFGSDHNRRSHKFGFGICDSERKYERQLKP